MTSLNSFSLQMRKLWSTQRPLLSSEDNGNTLFNCHWSSALLRRLRTLEHRKHSKAMPMLLKEPVIQKLGKMSSCLMGLTLCIQIPKTVGKSVEKEIQNVNS